MSTYVREPGDWKEKWVNFSLDEFKCQCGCGHVSVHSDLLDLLQTARNTLGPLTITSAGPHTSSKAVDIHVSNSQHRKKLIDYFASKVTGLGIAKTFIHIDIISSEELPHRPNAWIY